jgi:hypothetical protein
MVAALPRAIKDKIHKTSCMILYFCFRLFYSPEIIPRSLVFYLDNAHFCVCGSPCFEVFVKRYVPLQLNLISNTLTLSENVDTTVPTETFYCSYNCIKL